MDVNEENVVTEKIPILRIAWTRYAQLCAAAEKLQRPHYGLRRWIAILGVLATIFAVLIESYPDNYIVTVKLILKALLIASPLLASLLAVIYNRFHSSNDFQILRAGAEEILKEIYTFRTIKKNDPNRRSWLEKRLAEIQRQVYRGLGGEMVLEQYRGQIPPHYDPEKQNSDPGFSSLNGDEYFAYRLQDQLAWHIREINKTQLERKLLQWAIGIAGALGAAFAALDFYLWVTITAAFAAAFIGWQELRNLDSTIKNHSKVIVDLTLIYDHWLNLEPEERTDREFHKLVRGTEKVLWSQNLEYIRLMQDVLEDAELEEEDLTDDVLKAVVASDERSKEYLSEGEEAVVDTFEEALGTLVEEASSELVQQELAAMRTAAAEAMDDIIRRVSKVRAEIDEVAAEFGHIDFSADTPAAELHAMMERLPKTGEVKG